MRSLFHKAMTCLILGKKVSVLLFLCVSKIEDTFLKGGEGRYGFGAVRFALPSVTAPCLTLEMAVSVRRR